MIHGIEKTSTTSDQNLVKAPVDMSHFLMNLILSLSISSKARCFSSGFTKDYTPGMILTIINKFPLINGELVKKAMN